MRPGKASGARCSGPSARSSTPTPVRSSLYDRFHEAREPGGFNLNSRRAYKAHLSVDPDAELVCEVIVTPANTHDATPAEDLLAGHAADEVKPTVMGDCAYGTAETLARLEDAGYTDVKAKVAPATGREGRFGKDDFTVDLEAGEVTCPAGNTAAIRTAKDGSGLADFASQCTGCLLRSSCTTSTSGRTVTIHAREDLLQAHKPNSATPNGRRPTPGPGRRWSARSPTSSAGHGEGDGPGSADRPASRRTPTPAPRPSTGPASPPSGSTSPVGRVELARFDGQVGCVDHAA